MNDLFCILFFCNMNPSLSHWHLLSASADVLRCINNRKCWLRTKQKVDCLVYGSCFSHRLQILTQHAQGKKPFGYSRKDVLLIGVGVTAIGIGLKSGLEFAGVDPLQAGNVVQLVLVLGLTIGWISTYIFRVSNKEMTYAQQIRDYESKVMEKRLEGLTEAELEALLEQVEEEKRRLGEQQVK
ncbi:uncharacterized protein LOC126627434 isoform X2 [Malus sylvestris]|uniref:uncharacterized protein isoform X2 n=1 Tax=Malus domestica TaxID=3750 RepID=UPI0007ECF833|nr:uncharacterized protein LOC103438095 isoform X2 [Malus domestica]XP_050152924.1 uncharacterized protein LOC126627434 isoform X2 [Malus sylvestris]